MLHPTTATHGVLGAFAAESLRSVIHLLGGADDDIAGGGQRDLVLAGGGSDKVVAGGGNDVVLAGLGRDFVAGGDGKDILAGGAGCDVLAGGNGADVLAGSDGRDIQRGGNGGDLLIDGLGVDRLVGGNGRDAFIYVEAAALGGDNATNGGVVLGGAGHDTLYLLLDDDTRAAVEAELQSGSHQPLRSLLGLELHSVESIVFLDANPCLNAVATHARIAEADLWGLM
jgi:hypothetical protein